MLGDRSVITASLAKQPSGEPGAQLAEHAWLYHTSIDRFEHCRYDQDHKGTRNFETKKSCRAGNTPLAACTRIKVAIFSVRWQP
jgi:hypothetical protein